MGTQGLDVKTRTYTTRNGDHVLPLLPVSFLLAEAIRNNLETKPKIPMRRVVYGGQEAGLEPNPNDPTYRDELTLWQSRCAKESVVYVIATGVNVTVPDDFVEKTRQYFPNASNDTVKYNYVGSLIVPEEMEDLVNAILGQTGPTEDGVNAANADFPGDEQRLRHPAIPVESTPR